ncbi:MAG: sigma-70 family RNA polymerase sigma factor [Actinomycetia bacterium]|nr:sigma-70 family RNA polymerase sigma factor [Actinomycetes bacterium]MCP4227272.1 sigma-70 family RNA polymerase sigma factor [Actinomycetes bacterium]MCP5035316.1 sigma-70 family RNA polymerase sigma factor [Actinomycetes bacterium]
MTTVLTDEQREMVLTNVPLVEHIVNRIASSLPSSYSRDDLVQTGVMGLITATVRFDSTNGAAFSTFAGRRIEGAILDMLRRSDWAPRSVRAMERRLSDVEDQGPSPRVEAASRQLGVDRSQIERLRQDILKARLDSLDRAIGSEDGSPTPLSATVIDRGDLVEDIVDDQELVGYLRDGVGLLSDRHRLVVVGYFFEGKTMTDLGTLLGVTQSRASQIKDEALTMLKGALDEVYGNVSDGKSTRSSRQRAFNQSLVTSRSWRDRLAAGKGISFTG